MTRSHSLHARSLLGLVLFLVPACGGGGGGGGGGGPQPDPNLVPDVDASRFTVTPGFGTPSDGSTTVDIEFELISLRGRPLVGAQMDLEVSGQGNVLQTLPPSDAQGKTRGTLASFAGERKSIRASTMSGGEKICSKLFFSDGLSAKPIRRRSVTSLVERLKPSRCAASIADWRTFSMSTG